MNITPDLAADFASFHDAIHGQVTFSELPPGFLAPLRAALNSRYLDRLTRISQLGHTSLTFFSATQTRFSHAVGSLLVMNRIMTHLWGNSDEKRMPTDIIEASKQEFPEVFGTSGSEQLSIRNHLLLAALMQDVGELPFQKITSHFFRPTSETIKDLAARLPQNADPAGWKVKDIFTGVILAELLDQDPFREFHLDFLIFLIVDTPLSKDPHLLSLRQMLNGAVDADRLDYVYRDAHLTIGSVASPDAVIRTIKRYEADHVVVDNARPVADFLATRARLWSFVYSAPAVRFRQMLLRSFLQAAFSSSKGIELLSERGLPAELSLAQFVDLDDHQMLSALRSLEEDKRKLSHVSKVGLNAREILLKPISEYECFVLKKPDESEINLQQKEGTLSTVTIPPDIFFDLQLDRDENNSLYFPDSVKVEQPFTRHLNAGPVPLESCSGSLGGILGKNTSTTIVPHSFLLFVRESNRRNQSSLRKIENAVGSDLVSLFVSLSQEDIKRDMSLDLDTWPEALVSNKKKIALSCSFKDRVVITRIIRALKNLGQPYRVLLDSLLGLGNTPLENSEKLIDESDAVFIVMSTAYLDAWLDNPTGYIAAEVRRIQIKPPHSVVILPLLEYEEINDRVNGRWSEISRSWIESPIIVPEPLRGSEGKLRELLRAACDYINVDNINK